MPRRQPTPPDTDYIEDKSEFPEILARFFAEFGDEEQGYKCAVFEITTTPGARQKLEFIRSFIDTIPSLEDIASLGAGTYRIVMTYTRKGSSTATSTSQTITISPRYSDDKTPKGANMPNLPALMPVEKNNDANMVALVMQQSQQSTALMVGMMQQFMATIGGILEQRERRGNTEFANVNKMMQDIMLQNIDQQQAIIGKLMGEKAGIQYQEEEEDDEMGETPQTLFGWIKKIFYEYGDELLKSGPMMQKLFRSQIQNNPQFQAIQQDPKQYLTAYESIIADAPGNKDKLDQILTMLDAPNPEEIAASMAELEATK